MSHFIASPTLGFHARGGKGGGGSNSTAFISFAESDTTSEKQRKGIHRHAPTTRKKHLFAALEGESLIKDAPLAVPATYSRKNADLKAFLCLKIKKKPLHLHVLFDRLGNLAHAHPV